MKLEPTCPLSTTQVEKLPEPGLFLSAYLLGFMSYLWSNVVAAKTCTISISSNSERSFLKSDSLAALLGHGKKQEPDDWSPVLPCAQTVPHLPISHSGFAWQTHTHTQTHKLIISFELGSWHSSQSQIQHNLTSLHLLSNRNFNHRVMDSGALNFTNYVYNWNLIYLEYPWIANCIKLIRAVGPILGIWNTETHREWVTNVTETGLIQGSKFVDL